jgi:general secretion pathway protein N
VRRRPGWRPLVFAAAFLFALIALLPLRVALDWSGAAERGFSARTAEGSAWLGYVVDGRFGPLQIHEASMSLRTLPLILGQARVDIRDPVGGLRGSVTFGRHGIGVDDISGSVAFAAEPLGDASLIARDVSVHFRSGLCAKADGEVSATMLDAPGGSGSLSGRVRCEGRAMVLPLAGAGARIALRLSADGRYVAESSVEGLPGIPARVEGSF